MQENIAAFMDSGNLNNLYFFIYILRVSKQSNCFLMSPNFRYYAHLTTFLSNGVLSSRIYN